MRYSKQRELILNIVLRNQIHPSAEEVYKLLKVEYPTLSLGTVYRNLNFLAENNMLKKICIPEGSDRYDGTLTRHQHIICRKCGKVSDINLGKLETLKRDILRSTGFDADINALVFEGVCSECGVE